MASYYVTTNSNSGTAGDNVWLELTPPSGVSIAIKKISMSITDAAVDTTVGRFKVFRETTGATNMVSTAVEPTDPSSPAALTTAGTKQQGVFSAIGTTTDRLLDIAFSTRHDFEWIARDPNNYLWSGEGERICTQFITTAGNQWSQTIVFEE